MLFPLASGIIFLSLAQNTAFTVGNFLLLPTFQPLFYVVFATPLVFMAFGWWLGRRNHARNVALLSDLDREEKRAHRVSQFALRLQQGEAGAQYEPDGPNDKLGMALVELQKSILNAKNEEEARKREDMQRHWATDGLAKFSDILRSHSKSLEELSEKVIHNLVKYTDSNQGAFFILQHDEESQDRYFEMMACIAYERKKYVEKRLEWGEGLVGRCGLENEPIFMTDVPDDYIKITSGLGTSNPRCLLLVPLLVNDQLHGVMELASFKVFEEYQVNFVVKLAESIAATIATVKINLRTSQLLKESQEQSEKLAKQEEEMRQNVQVLRRTQKEAAKQSEEFVSFTNSVNHTLIRAEYNTEGKLLYANTKFLSKLGYSGLKEVQDRKIEIFINKKDQVWFSKIWNDLAKGGNHFEDYMKHVTKDGHDLWTMATYTCVRNMNGEVEKILFLAIDTTEEKKKSLDYLGQIEALNRSSVKVEYSRDGNIHSSNQKFLKSMDLSQLEIQNKSIFSYMEKDEVHEFLKVWDEVLNGKPYEGQVKLLTSLGEERWFQGTYTAVNDMYHEVAKVVFIAYDITEQKRMEMQAKEQTEILRMQEEKLRQSEIELSMKLEQAREEMAQQYKQIEHVKVLNEKTLEGALDAIVTVDSKGIVQFFNRAAEELWIIEKGQVMGKSVRELLPPSMKDTTDQRIRDYLTKEAEGWFRVRREVTITDKTGEEVPVLITIANAQVGSEQTFTAFIQNVSIELF